MKWLSEFLEMIGINISIFIVGLIGAVLMAGKQKDMKPWERIFTILGGAFTANYLTPSVQEYFNISEGSVFGAGFVLGYSGLFTLELIIKKFHKKIEDNQEVKS